MWFFFFIFWKKLSIFSFFQEKTRAQGLPRDKLAVTLRFLNQGSFFWSWPWCIWFAQSCARWQQWPACSRPWTSFFGNRHPSRSFRPWRCWRTGAVSALTGYFLLGMWLIDGFFISYCHNLHDVFAYRCVWSSGRVSFYVLFSFSYLFFSYLCSRLCFLA